MKINPTLACAVVLGVFGSAIGNAALVTFSFTGSVGNEASFAPDSQPTGGTVVSMTRGSGLTATAGAGAFNSSAWTTSATKDDNDYYTFTITPDANFQMTLSRLELDELRSATGIREWAIYSSLDTFGSALATFAIPDDTNTRTDQGVNLGAAFTDLSTAVSFRIYGYQAEGGAGTWRIDNVELSGTISAVPESVHYSLLGAIGVLAVSVGRAWRRSRRAGAKDHCQ